MNENAKLWVEALRSGEYKQGHGALERNDGGYCCLGVLCKVYSVETGDPVSTIGNARPPLRVADWAGLSDLAGGFDKTIELDDLTEVGTLIEMNDSGRFSFEQIAKHIESEPDGLFE